ncbi:MAG: DUF2007 domain-containing protein [Tahibacter sp.]
MRTIYHAATIIDAHLVKGALEEAGITAFVAGEYLTGGMGQLPVSDLVRVMVADHDAETAERIAAELDAQLHEPAEEFRDDEGAIGLLA